MRDRVTELRRVKASDLHSHPMNWRKHPDAQRSALQTVLDDIGFADAVIARDTPDGLQLIDGHLRRDTLGDELIPVLVVDLDDAEAATMLATYDPLSAMAKTDKETMYQLVSNIENLTPAMQAVVDAFAGIKAEPLPTMQDWEPTYQVIVNCTSEQAQADLLETLTAEGYVCRALVS